MSEYTTRVMIDSGAHSWFNKFHRGSPAGSRLKFYRGTKFKKYLEGYIGFLLEHREEVSSFVGLDIIGDPKATYEINKYMRTYGLEPMPVVHYGTSSSWIKKYLDVTDYIGISGLGQKARKSRYGTYLKEMFKYIHTDKRKPPSAKVHGFAMTTPEFIKEYPFYSMDSTTWCKMAGMGQVMIPRIINKNAYEFLEGRNIGISSRVANTMRKWHTLRLPEGIVSMIDTYTQEVCGVSVQQASIDLKARNIINIIYYFEMQKQLKSIYVDKFDWDSGGFIFLVDPIRSYKKLLLQLFRKGKIPDNTLNCLVSYIDLAAVKSVIRFKNSLADSRIVTRPKLKGGIG